MDKLKLVNVLRRDRTIGSAEIHFLAFHWNAPFIFSPDETCFFIKISCLFYCVKLCKYLYYENKQKIIKLDLKSWNWSCGLFKIYRFLCSRRKIHFTPSTNFEKCNFTSSASKNNIRTTGRILHTLVWSQISRADFVDPRVQRSHVDVSFYALDTK